MYLNYMEKETVLGGLSKSTGFSMTKILSVLDEFARSKCDFAEIVYAPGEYASMQSAYCAVRSGIKRFGYAFRVRTIHGKLYLDKN